MTNAANNTQTVNFVATSVKLVSENYPYGYTLKTTKYDYLEFKKGKGFRHVSQTINPKTGRLNAPKAGTYSDVLLLRKDENNHVKCGGTDFYGDAGMNKGCKLIADNFDLFTPEQIKHIYEVVLQKLVMSVKAIIIYCGAKKEDVLPLYQTAIDVAKEGHKTGSNLFNLIELDVQAIDATKVPDYNPFKITTYQTV
jgi:hypothetical protein